MRVWRRALLADFELVGRFEIFRGIGNQVRGLHSRVGHERRIGRHDGPEVQPQSPFMPQLA